MKDFKDKGVVITSGATGIGFSFAKQSGKEGAKLVIASRKMNRGVVLQEAHRVLEHVHMLGPGHFVYSPSRRGPPRSGRHTRYEFVPVPLAGVRDETAHLGVVPRHWTSTVPEGHQCQPVCCMELACPDRRDRDQATRRPPSI
jgi:hypothetical protein